MSMVSLTQRQLTFFNYFKEYQQTNGFFPTPSQAVRDLRNQGVKCSAPTIETMIGNLFLKGAFTGGQTLSWGNRHRSSAIPVTAIDVSKLPMRAKTAAPVNYANTTQPQMQAVPKQNNPLDGIDLNKLRALLAAL